MVVCEWFNPYRRRWGMVRGALLSNQEGVGARKQKSATKRGGGGVKKPAADRITARQ